MTPEERIAQLEAEVRSLRLIAEGQAVALRDATARLAQEGEAAKRLADQREAARLKKRRQRAEREAAFALSRDSVTAPSTGQSRDNTGTTPAPPSPFPSSFPPSPETSSPYPLSFPPSSPPPSASQGTASPSRDFELTSPTSKKRNRKPSEAEGLYETLEATRKQRCDEVGEEFIAENWPHARINRDIGAVLRKPENERARFESAWGLYLGDDGMRAKTPAWSLSYFMSSGVRAKYETMAAREEAA